MTGERHDAEKFFARCPRGLEPLLEEEVMAMGGETSSRAEGGVAFTGSFGLAYRVNLESRLASRVLWRVFEGPYQNEQDVYEATRGLPWADWFSNRLTIKVGVHAHRCRLKSLNFLTIRIKDGICDRFVQQTGARPTVETSRPDIRVEAFLDQHRISLYLDTSGEPLFKRGLGRARSQAPLRENLAAGILRLAGWQADEPLLDPMCGGGTILMEAAQMALDIAPGLGRHFAFEKLNNFDRSLWRSMSESRRAGSKPEARAPIYGSDHSAASLRHAKANLEAAGLAHAVALRKADVLGSRPPAESGILVTNPPYGVRTGKTAELALFYPRLGDVLKQAYPGWRAYFFTADLRLPKLIGLACSRRIPLFNGALECRLFEFKLFKGSMRRPKEA